MIMAMILYWRQQSDRRWWRWQLPSRSRLSGIFNRSTCHWWWTWGVTSTSHVTIFTECRRILKTKWTLAKRNIVFCNHLQRHQKCYEWMQHIYMFKQFDLLGFQKWKSEFILGIAIPEGVAGVAVLVGVAGIAVPVCVAGIADPAGIAAPLLTLDWYLFMQLHFSLLQHIRVDGPHFLMFPIHYAMNEFIHCIAEYARAHKWNTNFKSCLCPSTDLNHSLRADSPAY